LKGIEAYPDILSQKMRYLNASFDKANAMDMKQMFKDLWDPSDLQRYEISIKDVTFSYLTTSL
jgi:hypothetical protein